MNHLSVCAIIKNEELYLYDWLEHYKNEGVEHFYLYLNDESREKYVLPENVKIAWHHIPGKKAQSKAYKHCIDTYSNGTKWCAFLDCDEYLYSKTNISLSSILDSYDSKQDNLAGVAVHWKLFGSNNHKEYENLPAVKRFTRCASVTNPHVKSIMKMDKTISPGADAHHFYHTGIVIDENENVLEKHYSLCYPATSNILCINHYATKSEAECNARRSKIRVDTGVLHHPDFFKAHNCVDEEDLFLFNKMKMWS